MASKSIRNQRLTGARIPESKKQAAIFFFVDGVPATEVAKTVGISLDSARAIRDREQKRIMKLREKLTREYERLQDEKLEEDFRMEAERYDRQWLQEIQQYQRKILGKQNAIKLSSASVNSTRPHVS